jgi:hypothetical protein
MPSATDQHTAGPPPRYGSIVAASRYSGLSATTLRRLVAAGRLTCYRPTESRVLIDLLELDALVRSSAAPAGVE